MALPGSAKYYTCLFVSISLWLRVATLVPVSPSSEAATSPSSEAASSPSSESASSPDIGAPSSSAVGLPASGAAVPASSGAIAPREPPTPAPRGAMAPREAPTPAPRGAIAHREAPTSAATSLTPDNNQDMMSGKTREEWLASKAAEIRMSKIEIAHQRKKEKKKDRKKRKQERRKEEIIREKRNSDKSGGRRTNYERHRETEGRRKNFGVAQELGKERGINYRRHETDRRINYQGHETGRRMNYQGHEIEERGMNYHGHEMEERRMNYHGHDTERRNYQGRTGGSRMINGRHPIGGWQEGGALEGGQKDDMALQAFNVLGQGFSRFIDVIQRNR